MNEPTAVRAVEDELAEIALEVGFHVEEVEAQHLRVDRYLMGAVEAGGNRLVDQLVGLGGLHADRSDGPLEDVALSLSRKIQP